MRPDAVAGPWSEPDRVLLWDLDGTIVDTSRDLAAAINRMLGDYGYDPLPVPVVVGHIGKGARNLVARCLEEHGHRLSGDRPGDSVDEALANFEGHYASHLMDETEVYPGVAELLRELARSRRRMAVVTNKPERFSRDILARLDLESCFATVVGGETLATRKPAPEPLWYAIDVCTREGGSPPNRSVSALMLGDTWIDADAARAAGVPVVLVGWGLGDRAKARAARPDAWVETADELRDLLLPATERR